jgi:hypothetical protein
MSKPNVVFIDNSNNIFHHDKELELNKVSYLHPKGQPIVYILMGGDICELQVVEPNTHGSWFINQRISSDGKFYLVSKIDPRFLCLPYLEKSGTKYSPLDQIITRTEGCDRIPIEKALTWYIYLFIYFIYIYLYFIYYLYFFIYSYLIGI